MAKLDPQANLAPSSDPKVRGLRLRQLRQLTGSKPGKPLTRAALERKHGLNARTLKNWELGHGGGLSEKGARRAISIYRKEGIGCSITWLLEGVGQAPARIFKDAPQRNPNQVTNPIDTIDQEREYFISLHTEGIAFEVKDDAMAPSYMPGDVVGGIRHSAQDIIKLINHDCIVELKTGEILIRRLQNSTIPEQYNLYALNPSTKIERPTLYGIEILTAAPIMRHWKGKKWLYK